MATSTSRALVDWTDDSLVQSSPNFHHIRRISALLSPDELSSEIRSHEEAGTPLIIEDWNKHADWNTELFSIPSFIGEDGEIIDVRNVQTSTDVKMTVRELVGHYESISENGQMNENILYGKDVRCPQEWEAWLRNSLPGHFHPYGANDLFSFLPAKDRPETLMCYIGVGDTFTPAHKDLCGSFGHNLMCHTTEGGSAFWFMTASGTINHDAPADFFRNTLNTELDLESHKVTVEEFQSALFPVYVAEQRLGDLVLVPPRSCHQVVNRGGMTLKMSWSRMGVKSLEYSLRSELLLYHRICRSEIYRVKLTLLSAVKEYSRLLREINTSGSSSSAIQPQISELWTLVKLLDDVIDEEWTPEHASLPHTAPSGEPEELYTCDFCGTDIFQSFFMCSQCPNDGDSSEYICCPSCYIEGRSCSCGAEFMKPHQTWPLESLISQRNDAVEVLNASLPSAKRLLPMSEATLENSNKLKIFMAACILLKKIQRRTSTRRTNVLSCTPRVEPSHLLEATAVIQCKPCHAALCYRHILMLRNIHAAEAVLIDSESDEGSWHRKHRSEPVASHDDDNPSLKDRLASAAKTLTSCRPIDSKRSKPGFYDLKSFMIDIAPANEPSPNGVATGSEGEMRGELIDINPSSKQGLSGSDDAQSNASTGSTRAMSLGPIVVHRKRKSMGNAEDVSTPLKKKKAGEGVKSTSSRYSEPPSAPPSFFIPLSRPPQLLDPRYDTLRRVSRCENTSDSHYMREDIPLGIWMCMLRPGLNFQVECLSDSPTKIKEPAQSSLLKELNLPNPNFASLPVDDSNQMDIDASEPPDDNLDTVTVSSDRQESPKADVPSGGQIDAPEGDETPSSSNPEPSSPEPNPVNGQSGIRPNSKLRPYVSIPPLQKSPKTRLITPNLKNKPFVELIRSNQPSGPTSSTTLDSVSDSGSVPLTPLSSEFTPQAGEEGGESMSHRESRAPNMKMRPYVLLPRTSVGRSKGLVPKKPTFSVEMPKPRYGPLSAGGSRVLELLKSSISQPSASASPVAQPGSRRGGTNFARRGRRVIISPSRSPSPMPPSNQTVTTASPVTMNASAQSVRDGDSLRHPRGLLLFGRRITDPRTVQTRTSPGPFSRTGMKSALPSFRANASLPQATSATPISGPSSERSEDPSVDNKDWQLKYSSLRLRHEKLNNQYHQEVNILQDQIRRLKYQHSEDQSRYQNTEAIYQRNIFERNHKILALKSVVKSLDRFIKQRIADTGTPEDHYQDNSCDIMLNHDHHGSFNGSLNSSIMTETRSPGIAPDGQGWATSTPEGQLVSEDFSPHEETDHRSNQVYISEDTNNAEGERSLDNIDSSPLGKDPDKNCDGWDSESSVSVLEEDDVDAASQRPIKLWILPETERDATAGLIVQKYNNAQPEDLSQRLEMEYHGDGGWQRFREVNSDYTPMHS